MRLISLVIALGLACALMLGTQSALGEEVLACSAASETAQKASGGKDGESAAFCSATANCGFGLGTISCTSTTSGATCQAVDQFCPLPAASPGYVRCGTQYTYCPPCPPPPQICTPNTTRWINSGCCFCNTGTPPRNRTIEQRCSSDGTTWVNTGASACAGACKSSCIEW